MSSRARSNNEYGCADKMKDVQKKRKEDAHGDAGISEGIPEQCHDIYEGGKPREVDKKFDLKSRKEPKAGSRLL